MKFHRGEAFAAIHAVSGILLAVFILLLALPLLRTTSLILLQVSFFVLLETLSIKIFF